MVPAIVLAAVAALILLLVVIADRLDTRLGPKHTYLFGTEDGNRVNPFEDLSDGASTPISTCQECGDSLDIGIYRYCSSCARQQPADD